MNIDERGVGDYVEKVQKLVQERTGVRITKLDLAKIMRLPFFNMCIVLMRGDTVKLDGFIRMERLGRKKTPH